MTTNKKPSSNLPIIIAVLVFVGGLSASYIYKRFLVSEYLVIASLGAPCDLRKASCVSVFPSGEKVTFSIEPKTIPILKPITLNVKTEGVRPFMVNVDFIGLNMDMGFNRSKLSTESSDHFTGEFIIPICVKSKMEWEAQVKLETKQGIMMAPYRFYTTK